MCTLRLLWIFSSFLALVWSDGSVQFTTKYRQLVTSSTLNWASAQNGGVPEFAVVGGTELLPEESSESTGDHRVPTSIYICRARHEGAWIPGLLVPPACHISLLARVFVYPRYEVLQNVDNGARLSWVKWDKFQGFPLGAVVGGNNFFVARRKVEDTEDNSLAGHLKAELRPSHGFSHYLGKFNPDDGLGKVSVIVEETNESVFSDGEVLVETEPIRYELGNIKYNEMRKKITRKATVLATTSLRNPDPYRRNKLDSALAYDSKYFSSWGQVKSILKGLPTTVRNPNGSLLNEIKWGLPENEDRKDVYRVEVTLEPDTGANITLVGNNTESETPYTAKLIAVFETLPPTERAISGVRREIEMLDVHPEFSAVFFLSNDSLVPTTSTTTTTTTTTTTPTPPIVIESTTARKAKTDSIKRENQAGMLSDDGALSLKKQQDAKSEREAETAGNGSGSDVTISAVTAFLFTAFHIVMNKIT